jgi:twitching motility protein PilT
VTEPRQEELLGRIAVHLKMISMDQLAEATRLQVEGSSRPLGAILVEKGWITEAQLQKAVQAQKEYIARRRQAEAAGAPAAATLSAAKPAAARPAVQPAARPAAAHAAPAAGAAGTATAPLRLVPDPAGTRTHEVPGPAAAPQPAAAAAATRGAAPTTARLDALLKKAIDRRASDLHVHSGAPLKMRVHGEFVDESPDILAAAEAQALLLGCMTPDQRSVFERDRELDFVYSLQGAGRFRVNVYRQHRGVDGVFRVIPAVPPTLEDLGLPVSLARVINYHQGMVLLTGPAGCGKSSTMAALVGILNAERRDHILTIEDPIEFIHPSNRCVVNQRQVIRHTESFGRALRAALREDPDIIVIGELRDRETISLALTAAETGHLVLGTLHTNSAIRTISRILGVFPPNQQAQIRAMISESLKAIVSQRLIPTADRSRRVAALEILMCNRAVGNLIREGKSVQITSTLQTGAPHGMCLMDASLAALVKAGTITKDEALRHCEDPKRLAA